MIISLREHYDSALEKALEALEEGNLIIYPTDTLYGLGCDATNNDAVEKIYKIKNRERDKPLSMLVANMEQLNKFFSMSEEEKEVMLRYLPGPYTFIVDGKGEFEGKRIGVRVPDHYFSRKLALELGRPVISTSANISGKESPSCVEEIENGVAEQTAIIVDGGHCKYGEGSTVVDIKNNKIIRQGAGKFTF